jgi:hypothetical protein
MYSILLLLLTQCKCEGTFSTFTNVLNLSTANISMRGYRDGLPVTAIFVVSNGNTVQAGDVSGRAKGVDFNSGSSFSDSIVVEFNGKKLIHYGRKNGSNPNAVALTSNRSLFLEANYAKKTITEDKCYLKTEFVYTFTEADYLSAK